MILPSLTLLVMLWVGSDVRHVSRLAFFILVSACVGCGHSSYTVSPGHLAERWILNERDVRSHPDSLDAVSVEVGKRKVDVSLERDYEAIHRKWSCKSDPQDLSFATLWSQEVLVAALESNYALSTLSKRRALRIYSERLKKYYNAIRVDFFGFHRTAPAGPGFDIELRIDGNAYEPVKQNSGPPQSAWLAGGREETYYQSSFYFPRSVDGEDVLEGARSVKLLIASSELCVWRWGDTPQGH